MFQALFIFCATNHLSVITARRSGDSDSPNIVLAKNSQCGPKETADIENLQGIRRYG